MLIHKVPPHDIMRGVWCAISATRIYMSISSVIADSHRNIGTHSDTIYWKPVRLSQNLCHFSPRKCT